MSAVRLHAPDVVVAPVDVGYLRTIGRKGGSPTRGVTQLGPVSVPIGAHRIVARAMVNPVSIAPPFEDEPLTIRRQVTIPLEPPIVDKTHRSVGAALTGVSIQCKDLVGRRHRPAKGYSLATRRYNGFPVGLAVSSQPPHPDYVVAGLIEGQNVDVGLITPAIARDGQPPTVWEPGGLCVEPFGVRELHLVRAVSIHHLGLCGPIVRTSHERDLPAVGREVGALSDINVHRAITARCVGEVDGLAAGRINGVHVPNESADVLAVYPGIVCESYLTVSSWEG